jgi:hypothetical protein
MSSFRNSTSYCEKPQNLPKSTFTSFSLKIDSSSEFIKLISEKDKVEHENNGYWKNYCSFFFGIFKWNKQRKDRTTGELVVINDKN